jgi:HAE1 family hydrophobic/amphiphilic exporter-1
MTRLTQLALRQRSVAIMLAVGVFLTGLFSWGQLQQELLPDIQLPFVTVIASMPGTGAEDVAAQLTEPIERAIQNVPRLEQLQSTSANSLSLVVAQFSFGTDIKETLTTIDQQLGQASLPEGSEPNVTALNVNDQPVVIATIGPAEGADPVEAARLARDVVLPEVRSLEGVSSADLTGGPTPVIQITLDPSAMADAGVTLQQVTGVLQANQVAIPSGTLTGLDGRFPVTTEHRFESIEELKALVVGVSGQGQPGVTPTPVTLGQIAAVEPIEVLRSGYARTNGVPSLTLTVSKASGANTVEVADAVQATFAQVEDEHPGQLQIETIQDLSLFIKESRDGLVREGLLGAAFAILTIFLFLVSFRSTLVAAISIPLSILSALALMGLAGLSINVITLGGLAVAVGRVVDDAIVVLENIYRHRARGQDIRTAVLEGTREVAAAITSSTLTTVAVFLPLGFVGGIVSQFFLPFALAVTFALLSSLVVALTIVPVLAYFFVRAVKIQVNPEGELPETIWQRIYTPILKAALRSRASRWATVGVALVLFIGSLALVPLLPTTFIDVGGEKIVTATITPPVGATSDDVLARTEQAEDILLADPEVELVQSTIPGEADTGLQTLQAAFTGRPANSAQLTIRLEETADVTAQVDTITASLEPLATDGYMVAVEQQQAFAGGGLQIIVSGQDREAIAEASDAIVADLSTMDGVSNVSSDLAANAPQVVVTVDPNKAVAVGLTTAQVATEIRNVLVGQPLGTVTVTDGATLETSVRVDASVDSVDSLRQLPIGTPAAQVPLGQIAAVDEVELQGSVTRVDGSPAATISATVTSQDQGAVSTEAQSRVDGLAASGAIPEGVSVRLAGVTQQQNEAFGSLFFSMGVAVLAVYLVMVVVFGSLIDPFVILFSLPLATIGAFPALLITGRPIGISALIGFLMLIGIVVTNAIVLLDLVEQLRHKGLSTYDALIQGGRTRVRPILMTAVATILALMPVALGFSEGSIIAAELGTVVIGGLFSSTVLTLVIIPVIYSLVDGAKVWASRRLQGAAPTDLAGDAPSEAPASGA